MRPSLTLAVIAVLSCSTAGTETESNDLVVERIDDLIGTLHDQGHFNGAVVVGRDDQIIYERGFGMANAEKGALVRTDKFDQQCGRLKAALLY